MGITNTQKSLSANLPTSTFRIFIEPSANYSSATPFTGESINRVINQKVQYIFFIYELMFGVMNK